MRMWVPLAAGLLAARMLKRRRSLRGEVALITGGSKGLGLLLALELGRRGCSVFICARVQEELQFALQWLAERGVQAEARVCDVGDVAQVDALVEACHRRFGRVDLLLNNAGVMEVGPVESMDLADFHHAMNTMFWGIVHCTKAVLPEMLVRRRGRICNITSIGGKIAVPHLLPYCSAKFAAVGFSEGLHAELKHHGIQVTTIAPWLMRTGSYLNAAYKTLPEAAWFSLSSLTPLTAAPATRAAIDIVHAIETGRTEATIGWPAAAAALVHGVAPSLVQNLMAAVDLLLPRPHPEQPPRHGIDIPALQALPAPFQPAAPEI